MLQRKVQRYNRSKAIVIPSHLCDLIGITFGDIINFDTDGKKIVITPASTDRQVPQEAGACAQPGGYANE